MSERLMPGLRRLNGLRTSSSYYIPQPSHARHGLAIALYAGDYFDYLPPVDDDYDDSYGWGIDDQYGGPLPLHVKGLGLLYPNYVNSFYIFYCPGDKTFPPSYYENKTQAQAYGISYVYIGGFTSLSIFVDTGSRVKLTSDPIGAPICFDGRWDEPPNHLGQINVLCSDLHVETMPMPSEGTGFEYTLAVENYILQ